MAPRAASIRLMVLRVSRTLGFFWLARRLTRRKLRVLCYHGISLHDEHRFEPILFMSEATLRRRLAHLMDRGYPVVSLKQGLSQLDRDTVENAEVVITFDDGWKSTLTHAAPALREFGFPATVYVTTYYCDTQKNLFNVAIWFMLWKTKLEVVTFAGIYDELDGRFEIGASHREIWRRWIEIAERKFNAERRELLLGQIADALGLDINEVFADQRFMLMSHDEVGQISRRFEWDVQLHCHRHLLPEGSIDLVRPEISENRSRLEAWTGQSCTDFCYPSGKYHAQHPDWLRSLGLRSATTCDPGLNDPHTDRMLLKRYLDRETWSDLEFEAAISGFSEITARVLSAIGLKRN